MKKFLLTSLMTASLAIGASAEVKIVVTPESEAPTSTIRKQLSKADVLVEENFEGFIDNDVDCEYPLASPYNPFINPEFTHDIQWEGYKVFSSDGACTLFTTDTQDLAKILTPRGDYSGSIVLTFKACYHWCGWESETGAMQQHTGSTVNIGLTSASNGKFDVDTYDGQDTMNGLVLGDVRLYEDQGWCEIRMEFDNFSAYNDASIILSSSNAVTIDDIKVTTSVDKFIASPIISGVRDITETSFTVDFQPVRKSFNYYCYLYTIKGYDENTGEPIFIEELPSDIMNELEMMGMTVEEYLADLPESYRNYGDADRGATSFTFDNLDPTKDYYYDIRSHYVHTFSAKNIHQLNAIAAPSIAEASDISQNSFTANWNPIVKADSYEATLYGVNKVEEDSDNFIIFEEDFENVSSFTNASDIFDPQMFDDSISIDDLTSTPGWVTESALYGVKGMLGLDSWGLVPLTTPDIYVKGSDMIRLSLRVESPSEEFSFFVRIGDDVYQVNGSEGCFEDEVELPTNNLEVLNLTFTGSDWVQIFVDYVIVSQSLKAGDYTFTYMGKETTENTGVAFSNLDSDRFDMYGYSVKAIRGEGNSAIYSANSERMIVDLKNGKSFTGVTAIEAVNDNAEVTEVERYTIDGKRIDAPAKGLNIVRMSDGSVRKVMVR